MTHRYRLPVLLLACSCIAGVDTSAQSNEKQEKGKPKLTVKALPMTGPTPLKVTFVAELTGGANDLEEYYCPKAIWDWGDGGSSEKSTDCEPYEAGKSEYRRRYTEEHTFRRDGFFRVYFALDKRDKEIVTGWVTISALAGK